MSLSRNDLKNLRRLQLKKFRDQEQAFLIEGIRLCEEALAAAAPLQRALVCREQLQHHRGQALLRRLEEAAIPIDAVEAADLHNLADTQAPQGIVAVAGIRKLPPLQLAQRRTPLLLAIDSLADPGNLGTILRSAAWFGLSAVLLSRDTVELHNPKVVRSSMGALFHLEVHEGLDLAAIAGEARTAGWRLLTAEAGGGTPAPLVRASGRDLLVIGSEAHGLHDGILSLSDLRITIPGQGQGESLNAAMAAGILLYQLTIST